MIRPRAGRPHAAFAAAWLALGLVGAPAAAGAQGDPLDEEWSEDDWAETPYAEEPEEDLDAEDDEALEVEEEIEAEAEAEIEAEAAPAATAEPEGEAAPDEAEPDEEAPEAPSTLWLDGAPPPAEPGDGEAWQLVLPPLLLRDAGGVRTRAFFPLFYYRDAPDADELVVLNAYVRRGTLSGEVLFPVYWNLRGPDRFTFSIIPFYFHREGERRLNGLAPLWFAGRAPDEQYTFVPPLLFFAHRTPDFAFTLATLYWRVRRQQKVSWGLFPLVWASGDENGSSEVVLPFYFRFRDAIDDRTTTVVPPVYVRREADARFWGVAPLLLRGERENGSYTTIPPLLFHHQRFDGRLKLVTPLFAYLEDDAADGGSTFVSWLYQNRRGPNRLDAVLPIFFWQRDVRDGSSTFMATPLVWRSEDPASDTTVVFPFYAGWGTRGAERFWLTPLAARWTSERDEAAVTWAFPTFQTRREPDTFIFNVHPLVYFKDAPDHRHLVVPPLYFDFERPREKRRETVFFPLVWRFAHDDEVTQLVGNTYFRRARERDALGWEFHFFPLVAFGKPRPDAHWWSVLYGLAGYRRQGAYAQTQLLWIPFQTAGP